MAGHLSTCFRSPSLSQSVPFLLRKVARPTPPADPTGSQEAIRSVHSDALWLPPTLPGPLLVPCCHAHPSHRFPARAVPLKSPADPVTPPLGPQRPPPRANKSPRHGQEALPSAHPAHLTHRTHPLWVGFGHTIPLPAGMMHPSVPASLPEDLNSMSPPLTEPSPQQYPLLLLLSIQHTYIIHEWVLTFQHFDMQMW